MSVLLGVVNYTINFEVCLSLHLDPVRSLMSFRSSFRTVPSSSFTERFSSYFLPWIGTSLVSFPDVTGDRDRCLLSVTKVSHWTQRIPFPSSVWRHPTLPYPPRKVVKSSLSFFALLAHRSPLSSSLSQNKTRENSKFVFSVRTLINIWLPFRFSLSSSVPSLPLLK